MDKSLYCGVPEKQAWAWLGWMIPVGSGTRGLLFLVWDTALGSYGKWMVSQSPRPREEAHWGVAPGCLALSANQACGQVVYCLASVGRAVPPGSVKLSMSEHRNAEIKRQ